MLPKIKTKSEFNIHEQKAITKIIALYYCIEQQMSYFENATKKQMIKKRMTMANNGIALMLSEIKKNISPEMVERFEDYAGQYSDMLCEFEKASDPAIAIALLKTMNEGGIEVDKDGEVMNINELKGAK